MLRYTHYSHANLVRLLGHWVLMKGGSTGIREGESGGGHTYLVLVCEVDYVFSIHCVLLQLVHISNLEPKSGMGHDLKKKNNNNNNKKQVYCILTSRASCNAVI